MKDLAPNIKRQRLLIEGIYKIDSDEDVIKRFFKTITDGLKLRTYGPPTIHCADGMGKGVNSGYDAFVPLIDSGIYLGDWTGEKFLSMIIYTCKEFNSEKAIEITKEFWGIDEIASHEF